jgi:hypothetical protein
MDIYSAFCIYCKQSGVQCIGTLRIHTARKPCSSVRKEVLHNILIAFGTITKLMTLISTCSKESCIEVVQVLVRVMDFLLKVICCSMDFTALLEQDTKEPESTTTEWSISVCNIRR